MRLPNVPKSCVQRVASFFDFRGPFIHSDTACNSSLNALNEAVVAMRAGLCDRAVIAGSNTCFRPLVSLRFKDLKMINKDGTCKCLDESANGYCRSEAIVIILLERKDLAKRIYATVVNSKSGSDGYKEEGITFPGLASQRQLAIETYQEANINPADIGYIEAHVTGTAAGDPVEMQAMYDVICTKKKDPLLVGCVKASIGHAEGASGLCSVAKACIVLQKRLIPPNIHFNKPNPNIKGLMDGKMLPVLDVTPLPGELIPVNSFGFGGANTHVVLKGNFEERDFSHSFKGLPRLVNMCGRLESSVDFMIKKLKNKPSLITPDFLSLIDDFSKLDSKKMPFRGYTILTKTGRNFDFDITNAVEVTSRPVYVVFRDYKEILQDVEQSLFEIPIFQQTIQKFLDSVQDKNPKKSLTSIAAQISWAETLKHLNMKPKEVIASGSGFLAALYFNDVISFEEAVKCAQSITSEKGDENTFAEIFDNKQLAISVFKSVTSYINVSNGRKGLILEAGPNGLIKQGLDSKGSLACLKSLGEVYVSGVDVDIEKLYPAVTYPLPSSTPTLSSLIQWNHTKTFSIKPFLVNDAFQKNKLVKFYFNRREPDDAFFYDHKIDERILYPATGYLMIVWMAHAKFANTTVWEFPVEFSNVSFSRATVMDKGSETCLCTLTNEDNGDFVVTEGENVVVTGNIRKIKNTLPVVAQESPCKVILNAKQIYREFRVRGYDYGPYFQGVYDAACDGHKGTLIWRDIMPLSVKDALNLETEEEFSALWLRSWVTFVDAMFQLDIMKEENDSRQLFVPTRVDSISCFPDKFRKHVEQCSKFTDSLTLGQSSLVDVYRGHGNLVFTEGLVVKGLKTTMLKRRQQPITQFKYEFTPFTGLKVLSRHSRQTLRDYVKACTTKNSLNKFDINDKKCSLLRNIINGTNDSLEDDQLVGKTDSDNFYRQEFLHPMIDTVVSAMEFPLEKDNPFDVLEINSSDHILGRRIIDHWNDVLLFNSLKMNYSLIHPEADQLPSSTVNGITAVKSSSLSLESVPKKQNLIIVKFNDETNNKVLSTSFDKLHDGGFLIVYVNDNPTVPEANSLFQKYCPRKRFMSLESVRKEAEASGFFSIRDLTLDDNLPLKGLLLRKVAKDTSQLVHRVIEVGMSDFSRWFEDLKLFMREENEAKDKRLWIVPRINEPGCEKQRASGITGLVKSLRLEEGGDRLRTIIDFSVDKVCLEDPRYHDIIRKDLVHNVFDEGQNCWGMYQSTHMSSAREEATTKLTDNSYLRCLKPGDLTTLTWVENDVSLKHKTKVVDVSHSALNFRDIMFATGQLDSEAIPGIHPNVALDSILGLEFSGVMSDSGKRVMGITPYKGLSTKVAVNEDEDFIWDVPSNWSLEEASTVPVVYATAYYALFIRGNLRRGESVLIHSGCGGVGLAGINICLSMGCNVFTTCGSQRKRDYLASHFPALVKPNNNIFNSRDITFEEDIMKATSGRGVDVVLNSLAEDKLQAGLRCLAENGRFLEIGKVDFVRNQNMYTHQMSDNKSFHGVLLDALFNYSKDAVLPLKIQEEKRRLKELLKEGMREGVVKPLDRTVFSCEDVEHAFRFMASGKHIGKVLVKVRDDNNNLIRSLRNTYCYEHKSYIVLGGLGGFGLELVQWLASKGAKKLVISSRRGIQDAFQEYCIGRLIKAGNQVVISKADILTKDGAAELLREALKLGPVGGWFNTAVVYKDSLYQDQYVSQFKEVAGPKSEATRHFDLLTREMCPELDYFVTFSSISANRGNAGQTNYNFANSLMDSICRERRKLGLPGLSIQWGVVGDVGIVADISNGNDMVLLGSRAQRLHSCFESVNTFLQGESAVCLSYIKADPQTDAGSGNDEIDILSVITRLLGLKDMASMDQEITLGGLGVDSLIAVEIKQALDKTLGTNISVKEVRNLTIASLVQMSAQKTAPTE
jgi:fatty acid synthase